MEPIGEFDCASCGARLPKRDIEYPCIECGASPEWPNECIIKFAKGSVHCPAYPEPCSYVRICDTDGKELVYWNEDEWKDDPSDVMGAIIGAIISLQ